MPTSQVVNLAIGSQFGFKRPSFAPVPIMETIKSVNTTTVSTGTLANTSSRVITLSALTDFEFPIGNTATVDVIATYGLSYNEYLKRWTEPYKQTITISNVGTAPVTMFPNPPYRPTFMPPTNPGVWPVLHSAVGSYTIAAGATGAIELAYYGTDLGDFTSYFTIESTAGISTMTIFTNQIAVEETYSVSLTTNTFVVNTVELGRPEQIEIDLMAVQNGAPDIEGNTVVDFSTTIAGDPGWSITTGTNKLFIRWDPDLVENVNGVYYSTVTLTSKAFSTDIYNTSVVSINHALYKNLSSWISPAAYNNSVIGFSLDLVNNVKVLTIGVGVGGDGSPIYASDGSNFAQLNALGISAATIDTPYPYWSTVYSIPLTSTADTYLSGALDENGLPKYMVKTTAGLEYHSYFGFDSGEGSMFVVTHDGAGNVTVDLNNLRELSGEAGFDATLNNLTRSFYYYSTVDDTVRYYQLEPLPVFGTLTHMFRGFITYYESTVQKWAPDVSLVPLPT